MSRKNLFKVIFLHRDKVFEIFARQVSSSQLFGFLEIEGLMFLEDGGVVIDPTEEKLREEFADTEVLHLPLQSIIRVEEVAKRGQSRIRARNDDDVVTPFPMPPQQRS